MEKRVDSIVFRRLTKNDYDKINQPGSAYLKQGDKQGGGGQGYIDFPTRGIHLNHWTDFLGRHTATGAQNRGKWTVKINSLGLAKNQSVLISHRRDASVSITSQKKQEESSSGNRIFSWHPKNGFPIDYDPDVTNLVVYIVKTTDGEFWAGWFLQNDIPKNWQVNDSLKRMFEEDSAGYIKFKSKVLIDTEYKEWAFYLDAKTIKNQIKTEEDVEDDLLNQDTSPKLDDPEVKAKPEFRNKLLKIRERNKQIVKNLKKLYKGHCQISGDKLTFKKKNGEFYSEVHHLISLGVNGSDAYANAIVVSPLIHRMLHYAKVSTIDLSKIKDNKLEITINETNYEISWHPDHLKTVEKALKD
jgi:5-methylcytosine-specific restriction protein A